MLAETNIAYHLIICILVQYRTGRIASFRRWCLLPHKPKDPVRPHLRATAPQTPPSSKQDQISMGTRVYVGGLPRDATSREIQDGFSRYGHVSNIWVARNPPGFAFVVS
jgi:hypothetical protein